MTLDQLRAISPAAAAQAEAQIAGSSAGMVDVRPANHPGFPESSPATRRARGVATEVDGRKFPSKTEALVYRRLRAECDAAGLLLVLQARMPVWALTDSTGRPGYVTPDFVILDGRMRILRIVDAKPRNRKAVSRDWNRGRRALEASYGVKVEEVDR
jgi:hypothetical protein